MASRESTPRDLWSRLRNLGRRVEEEIYDFTEEDAERDEAMVEAGVDVHATDEAGNSALHRVAKDGEEAVVLALLEVGVRSDARNNAGHTALTLATTAGHQAVAKVLERG